MKITKKEMEATDMVQKSLDVIPDSVDWFWMLGALIDWVAATEGIDRDRLAECYHSEWC